MQQIQITCWRMYAKKYAGLLSLSSLCKERERERENIYSSSHVCYNGCWCLQLLKHMIYTRFGTWHSWKHISCIDFGTVGSKLLIYNDSSTFGSSNHMNLSSIPAQPQLDLSSTLNWTEFDIILTYVQPYILYLSCVIRISKSRSTSIQLQLDLSSTIVQLPFA